MTKYARQLASSQKLIAAKGVVCTWTRSVSDDTNGEPYYTEAAQPLTWQSAIVFIPATRQNLYTKQLNSADQTKTVRIGLMAGGQAHEPAEGDVLTLPDGSSVILTSFNVTDPDGTAILYELSLNG